MKIAFSFFLLIYSRCGAPASWAARHTIVCLDTMAVRDFAVIYTQCSHGISDIYHSRYTHLIGERTIEHSPCLFCMSVSDNRKWFNF